MASAAYTLTEAPATLESDTSEALISNGALFTSTSIPDRATRFYGELRNHGPADVWVKVEQNAAAATVVTTGAQAAKQVPLPAGSYLPIRKSYATIAHKTAAGTAVLSWVPLLDVRG